MYPHILNSNNMQNAKKYPAKTSLHYSWPDSSRTT